MRRWEKVSSARAAAAALPRIVSATRLSLRGLVRRLRRQAWASVSSRRRGAVGLPISAPPRPLVARMTVKSSGRRELAELVTDHVLGDQHGDEFVAIIDAESKSDELRKDRRSTRPRPDHLIASGPARFLSLLEKVTVDKRPFPNGACQGALRTRRLTLVPAPDDQSIRRLVVPGLLALGRLAPRRDRMAAARGATFAATMRMVDRVHCHASHRRAMTQPSVAPSLSDNNILLIRIRDGADRRPALGPHHAQFT